MKRVALYLRLSVEERSGRYESESITNQREFLKDYVKNDKELNACPSEEFVDDGFSGTGTNRPAFQRMMEAVKQGKIGTIIVKDMSRFMRDYITIGDYLENIFPFMGVRFIAINDGYDSNVAAGNGTELDIQFKNLLYDFYSKDCSEKIKSIQTMARRKGKYNNWAPPFGYMKDPNNRYRVILDEKTYRIVQDIFAMALDGLSTRKIAEVLNERGVITPAQRKREITNMTYESLMLSPDEEHKYIWAHGAIIKILSNENYTGTYCFNMTERPRVGARVGRLKPPEQWERVPNNHPAIVSTEDFQKLREMMKKKKKFTTSNNRRPNRSKSPLQGVIYCEDCGHLLEFTASQRRDKPINHFAYFRCRTCRANGIKRQGLRVISTEQKVLAAIKEKYGHEAIGKSESSPKEEKLKVDIKGLIRQKDVAFEKYKMGKISRDEFKALKTDIDQQIESARAAEEQETLETVDNSLADNEQGLTKDMVEHFIERIDVTPDSELKITFKR